MATDESNAIQTRSSLLRRLKTGDDTASWQEFYRIYGSLVRAFAIQAGLTDTEADEVVQETAIAMARHLPEFQYDPKVCRFKTWLLNQASWRIKDQIKKRPRLAGHASGSHVGSLPSFPGDATDRTPTIYRVPDRATPDMDAIFETEWRKNLLALALEHVREKFSLKQFQVFDLVVQKEWPAGEVARSLGLSLANVYVIKHRITSEIKREIRNIERKLDEAASRRGGGGG